MLPLPCFGRLRKAPCAWLPTALVAVMMLAVLGPAQAQGRREVIASLKSIDKEMGWFQEHKGALLDDKAGPEENTRLGRLFATVTKDLAGLVAAVERSEADDPADLARYAASVEASRTALASLKTADLPPPRKLDRLAGVGLDLHIKRNFAEKNPRTPCRSVKLEITTKQGGRVKGGFQVWYVAAGWYDTVSHFQKFPKDSSPTTEVLAPGNYVMWTRDPDHPAREGKKEPVPVGQSGGPVEPRDLPAPP